MFSVTIFLEIFLIFFDHLFLLLLDHLDLLFLLFLQFTKVLLWDLILHNIVFLGMLASSFLCFSNRVDKRKSLSFLILIINSCPIHFHDRSVHQHLLVNGGVGPIFSEYAAITQLKESLVLFHSIICVILQLLQI